MGELPKRIFGIDPGSKVVGFACIESINGRCFSPRDFKIIDVGVLKAPAKLPHATRLGILHTGLTTLLTECKPSVCVMERAFSGVNPFTALRLGEARGALIATLKSDDIPLKEVAPAHVKKIIAGNGAASKDDVARALEVLWKFNRGTLPHDATDALAIALAFGLSCATTAAATETDGSGYKPSQLKTPQPSP